RTEEHVVDEAEDRGVGADAEREREDRDRSEAGRFRELTQREFQIVHGRRIDGGNHPATASALKSYRKKSARPASLAEQLGAGARKVARGLGIVGSQLHRLLKLAVRLIDPAGLREGEAEGIVKFGVGGRELHRLLEMRQRADGVAGLAEREAQVLMRAGES